MSVSVQMCFAFTFSSPDNNNNISTGWSLDTYMLCYVVVVSPSAGRDEIETVGPEIPPFILLPAFKNSYSQLLDSIKSNCDLLPSQHSTTYLLDYYSCCCCWRVEGDGDRSRSGQVTAVEKAVRYLTTWIHWWILCGWTGRWTNHKTKYREVVTRSGGWS